MTDNLGPDIEKQLACLVFITPEVVDDARAALRAAIRTACVAAERRGIERAANECGHIEHNRYSCNVDEREGARLCAIAILALPVPESTEAGHAR